MNVDLSFKDIRFLRKVRDINSNPEAYERTEKGEVPASTGAIINASNLTEGEVKYRLGGSQCRGFEDMGLTVLHEAEFDEETKTFGAKSVELTQKGIDVLTDYEENNVFEDYSEDVPEVVKQLRGRVNQLEQQTRGSDNVDISQEIQSLRNDIERFEAELESLKQSRWGAVDERFHTDLDKTVKRLPPIFYLLVEVFGLDVDQVADEGPYDEDTLEELREAVAETLGVDMSESHSVSKPVSDSDPSPSTEPASMSDLDEEVESDDESKDGEEDNESVPPHLQNPFADDE